MMRADSPDFTVFGEIYFSEVLPGAVKAWKRHREMTQRLAVPGGQVLFVLEDQRSESDTTGLRDEVLLGRPDNYALLTIPPGVVYGFSCVSNEAAIIANCADLPHSPNESESILIDAPGAPAYSWGHRPKEEK